MKAFVQLPRKAGPWRAVHDLAVSSLCIVIGSPKVAKSWPFMVGQGAGQAAASVSAAAAAAGLREAHPVGNTGITSMLELAK